MSDRFSGHSSYIVAFEGGKGGTLGSQPKVTVEENLFVFSLIKSRDNDQGVE